MEALNAIMVESVLAGVVGEPADLNEPGLALDKPFNGWLTAPDGAVARRRM